MKEKTTSPSLPPSTYIPSVRNAQIKMFNKDNVSNALMTKVKKYVNNPDFSFENVAKVMYGNPPSCRVVHRRIKL